MKPSHLFAVLFAAGTTGCVVHSHGSMTVSGAAVVDVYQEPPPPRPDTPSMERPGFVWVHGRWTWVNNKWEWMDGHWDRVRSGQVWVDGHWDRRGDKQWHWVEGNWSAGGEVGGETVVRDHRTEETPPPNGGGGGAIIANPPRPVEGGGGEPVVRDHRTGGGATVTISVTPTSEPPPVRVDAHEATKAGFFWQTGRWEWKSGKWEWTPGHWERERSGSHYVDGKWELQGSTWVWVEGKWEAGASGPVIRDHRTH